MNTILVPLDGSRLAEQALPYAQMLAQLLGARVRLLQVISEPAHITMVDDTVLGFDGIDETAERYSERERRVWEVERQRAEDYLRPRAAQLHEAGLDIRTDVRLGLPAETIVEAARQSGASFVVMATHGASGLRRWALGSVTDKVVQVTTTPILVVRGGQGGRAAQPRLKRIMVPLDGSEFATQALPVAAELARHARAELVLMQTLAPIALNRALSGLDWVASRRDEIAIGPCEQAARDLETYAASLRREQIPATPVVMIGAAAEAIVDESARREVDLIVMATHGYGGMQRWALGSISDKVLHTTRTPLMLVRAR